MADTRASKEPSAVQTGAKQLLGEAVEVISAHEKPPASNDQNLWMALGEVT